MGPDLCGMVFHVSLYVIPGDLEFIEEYEDRKSKNQFVGSLGLQKQGSLL